MTRNNETLPLESEHIEAILEFLPVFERPEFRAYHGVNDGYYNWSPELQRFHEALYANNWVIDFDWMKWQKEAAEIVDDERLLAQADLETVRKVLTTLSRQEHFFTNAFPITCEDGSFTRILRRVKELHGETHIDA